MHATSVTGKNASIRIPCIPIGMQRARACVCVTNVQQSFKKKLVFIENVNNKVNKTSGESRTLSSTCTLDSERCLQRFLFVPQAIRASGEQSRGYLWDD